MSSRMSDEDLARWLVVDAEPEIGSPDPAVASPRKRPRHLLRADVFLDEQAQHVPRGVDSPFTVNAALRRSSILSEDSTAATSPPLIDDGRASIFSEDSTSPPAYTNDRRASIFTNADSTAASSPPALHDSSDLREPDPFTALVLVHVRQELGWDDELPVESYGEDEVSDLRSAVLHATMLVMLRNQEQFVAAGWIDASKNEHLRQTALEGVEAGGCSKHLLDCFDRAKINTVLNAFVRRKTGGSNGCCRTVRRPTSERWETFWRRLFTPGRGSVQRRFRSLATSFVAVARNLLIEPSIVNLGALGAGQAAVTVTGSNVHARLGNDGYVTLVSTQLGITVKANLCHLGTTSRGEHMVLVRLPHLLSQYATECGLMHWSITAQSGVLGSFSIESPF